jgi:palmitoyltransferase
MLFDNFASTIAEPSKIGLKDEGLSDRHDSNGCSKFGCCLCSLLAIEDCRSDEDLQQQYGEEDALFCTLCNAEVGSFTGKILLCFPNKINTRKIKNDKSKKKNRDKVS